MAIQGWHEPVRASSLVHDGAVDGKAQVHEIHPLVVDGDAAVVVFAAVIVVVVDDVDDVVVVEVFRSQKPLRHSTANNRFVLGQHFLTLSSGPEQK